MKAFFLALVCTFISLLPAKAQGLFSIASGPKAPLPQEQIFREESADMLTPAYYYHMKTAITTLNSSQRAALDIFKSVYSPSVLEQYNEQLQLLTEEKKEGFTIMGFHRYGALNKNFFQECQERDDALFTPDQGICRPPSERSRSSKYLIFQNQLLVGYVHFNSAVGTDHLHPQLQALKTQFPSAKKWLYKEILNHMHPPKKAHIKAYSLDHGGFREKIVFMYQPAGSDYPGQWEQKVFLESYYPLALKDHFEPLIVSNLRHNLSLPYYEF